MKKAFMLIAAMCMTSVMAFAQKTIRVSTDKTDLVMQVSPKGRLYQVYLGDKLKNPADYQNLKWDVYAASDGAVCQRGHEVYATSGAEDFFEPAVAVTHADGNMTTYLYYKSSEEKAINGGTETIITLQDKVYPLTVKLHYAAYPKENVIKAWSEISHKEKAPVTLWRYSSTMLYFKANKYFVTNYHSDWAKEGQPETCQLTTGKKIVDTKLGTRAAMQEEPFFELGFDEPAKENEGKVMLGTIGWPGNFRFTFEVDNVGALRVIPAINPYASDYKLKAGETFATPEFIFAMSDNGMGEASRNLHNWARQYQVNMGMEDRLTLLNNWENTGFDFNQQSLAELMKDAKDLGVDMFLLDDGWFANKYPRKDDHAGLGDWEATKSKLPEGIPGLVRDAKKAGVKFGIWIEPEMVNPKSELFEKHPDWVIMQPKRDTYYYRNQLVLDISNPKVQDYVFGIVDRIMTENPDVAYFKWDCNSVITNIYSPYHKENQGNFYIDHVRGIYKVLTRIHNKYPRKDDHAGLGDWEATKSKLPDGIPGLVRDAKKAGVKFGIWIEPEMVNPKSELFEKHPDWVIMQPKRDTYYYRNQLVLDISNPKVQDYVFGIVDRIMTENPDVAYFKWDCNSVITNIYSPYHKGNQGNFYIDHVRGIYKIGRAHV